ncbi:MAG: carboxypeptidase-like regulatory domain-containing protein [Prevotellaceae bacterium]|nr:carboxypeptidase-like regulatory domain-containing protein [Prevotellaceae bacterium]MDD6009425.1 carboxypeptidase-like regulatory domain-containing protein [Prevotellaceae bacterium]
MESTFKRHIVTTLVLLVLSLSAVAQSFSLSGSVVDNDGNPIELATVACVSQAKVTMTNLKGKFSLQLQSADSVIVRFSMVGYKTRQRILRNPRGKQTLRVVLNPMESLDELVVTERRRQTTQTEKLDIKDVRNSPSATGNSVEELVQQQAGVSSHNEMSSQYNVRGGSFDENAVYINNVEVYRPFLVRSGQQEGLSIINPDLVGSVAFSTGGFEAKYGDKMSSVLDITYRQPQKTEASASVSLLGASAYVGIGGKRFSMSHGLRYKTNKYLLGSLDTEGEYKPDYLDYQTFISYRPDSLWSVDFIGNISDNHYTFQPSNRETSFGTLTDVKSFKVYFDGQEKDLFRTLFGALNITRRFGKNTSVSLLASAFYTKEQETYDIQGQYWLDDVSNNTNIGVGTYMEHGRNFLTGHVENLKLIARHKTKRHDMEASLAIKFEKVKENSTEYEMRDSSGYSIPHTADRLDLIYSLRSQNEIDSRRIEGYLMDTYRFATDGEKQSFFTLNYGLRFSNWSFNGETTVSPRASLAIVPGFNHDVTFRLATGIYYQTPFYKELRDTSTVNGRTVVTLNEKIKSQQSIHFVAAFDYRFKMLSRQFKFTTEAYYKRFHNLIPYNINNVKVTYYGENLCDGYAAGMDFKLYGEFVPGTDSWLTFSLMKTRQTLYGVSLPLPTDQRYSLNLHFTDYFPGTERWRMTLRLAYADGLPFGPPHSGIERMQFRAPAYKRADIGLSYLLAKGKENGSWYRNLWLAADCLNLLGISNVNSYYWVTDVTNNQFAVPNYLTGRRFNVRFTIEM